MNAGGKLRASHAVLPCVIACLFLAVVAERLYHYPTVHRRVLHEPLVSAEVTFVVQHTQSAMDINLILVLPGDRPLSWAHGGFCTLRTSTGLTYAIDSRDVVASMGFEAHGVHVIGYSLTRKADRRLWGPPNGTRGQEVTIRFADPPPAQSSLWLFWMQPRNRAPAVEVTLTP